MFNEEDEKDQAVIQLNQHGDKVNTFKNVQSKVYNGLKINKTPLNYTQTFKPKNNNFIIKGTQNNEFTRLLKRRRGRNNSDLIKGRTEQEE